MADKRFKVALSFPGEHREYIKEVAEHLSFALGREKVFYDDNYIEELARPNLDIYLTNIYKDHSDLVVYFLCEDYAKKKWCKVEWRAIRSVLFNDGENDLMQFRFDQSPVEGALDIDGYIEINGRTPRETSELIIKRIRKNDEAVAQKNNAAIANLKEKEKELLELKELQVSAPTLEIQNKIQTLTFEKEALRQQLLQKESTIAQQENTRKELEQSLAAEQEKEALKKQALEAVEEKDYDKAENLLKEAANERMQKVAEDFYQLGNIKELKLEYTEALDYYELAAKIPPYNSDYLAKAAELCGTFGLLDKAFDYVNIALSIDIQKFGEEHESTAYYYSEIGILWKDRGDPDKAISYFEKALEIYLKLFGEEHSYTATAYNNLGTTWQEKGDLDKAINFFEKALKIDLIFFEEEHPTIATRYNNFGTVWKDKGDIDKAIGFFEKALKIDLQLLGEENGNTAIDYNNLGSIWIDKGDTDKAINFFEKALKIDLKLFGVENPKIASDYNGLGWAWREKGDLDKAIELTQKSYEVFLKLYGTDNPTTKIVKQNLDILIEEKNSLGKKQPFF